MTDNTEKENLELKILEKWVNGQNKEKPWPQGRLYQYMDCTNQVNYNHPKDRKTAIYFIFCNLRYFPVI